MTLNEWCKRCGVKPTHPTTEAGAVSVIISFPHWGLYHLDDYVVSSVSGPVVWLVPRKPDGSSEQVN